jgi:hypothetical protein
MKKAIKKLGAVRKIARRASLKRSKPTILIIDDIPEDGDATRKLLSPSINAVYREPSEVGIEDIKKADLVLVDFKLDHWPARDRADTPPALRPMHGVALAGNLRSGIGALGKISPTAFALRSGKLAEVSGRFSPFHRQHSLARMLDLEWVFAKGENDRFDIETKSLVDAVRQLPTHWPSSRRGLEAILKLLIIKDREGWFRNAANDVSAANPPQDALAEISNGLAVIRWLLHEVLPYPSFLLDARYIATRLRVSPAAAREQLESKKSKIATALSPYRYTGVLSDFAGPRWWRAGIDHWLWVETKGAPLNGAALKSVSRRFFTKGTHLSELENPVVTLDDQFRPTDDPIELVDAVQVKPDDWPNAAEPAWVPIREAAGNPDLAARVVAIDRDRLKDTNN